MKGCEGFLRERVREREEIPKKGGRGNIQENEKQDGKMYQNERK